MSRQITGVALMLTCSALGCGPQLEPVPATTTPTATSLPAPASTGAPTQPGAQPAPSPSPVPESPPSDGVPRPARAFMRLGDAETEGLRGSTCWIVPGRQGMCGDSSFREPASGLSVKRGDLVQVAFRDGEIPDAVAVKRHPNYEDLSMASPQPAASFRVDLAAGTHFVVAFADWHAPPPEGDAIYFFKLVVR